jgi:hypothetical protein
MAIPVKSTLDFENAAKAINLPAPVAAGDATNKAYVDNLVNAFNWKDDARVRSTANVNVAAPGANVDGVAMVAGNRVLLTAQTAGAENGIWIWNGAAVAMTRPLDFDDITANSNEILGSIVPIREGTSADTQYVLTNDTATLGTTTLTFTPMGSSVPPTSEVVAGSIRTATQAEVDAGILDLVAVAPLKLKNYAGRTKAFPTTIGDGAATTYTVPHNLNSQDVDVTFRETTGLFRAAMIEWQATTVNTITVLFATPPALNSIRCIVQTQPS